ncbi:anti-sigma regulatory factor [Streptomyces chryseus]|uniref:anti-sigma regulatory factor n=2 Tax=Streptomyces chryseus TaxID=68186 RepID=UPI00110FD1C2|nr:anti-sigma regulatory factor [Streptomyces chryseus]
MRIDHPSGGRRASNAARSTAEQYELTGAMPDQAAVVASELARHRTQHARGGPLYLQPLLYGAGLQILTPDRGPGMPAPQRCRTGGHTTTGTVQAGMGAVSRIATDLVIRTEAGTGTPASARLALLRRPHLGQEAGLWDLAAVGERERGDTGATAEHDKTRTANLVDGLGHGPHPAEVAQIPLRASHTSYFRLRPPPPLPAATPAHVHRSSRDDATVLSVQAHQESR